MASSVQVELAGGGGSGFEQPAADPSNAGPLERLHDTLADNHGPAGWATYAVQFTPAVYMAGFAPECQRGRARFLACYLVGAAGVAVGRRRVSVARRG